MTKHIPLNVNQSFFIIQFENRIYMLFDSELSPPKIMYIGVNRNEVEAMLKQIVKFKRPLPVSQPTLMVYKVVDEKLTPQLQSSFYNILQPIAAK